MTIKSQLLNNLEICAAQFIVSFIVVINTIAYTNNNYLYTILTDIVFAASNFFIIDRIAKGKRDKYTVYFYIIGCILGSILSMYISYNVLHLNNK